MLRRRRVRVLIALCGVVAVTYFGYRLVPVNATTVGFYYLLVILIVASVWGFLEAALASILATLMFNFFFLPPVGTFTIADSQNWVALSAFLGTSLIASRLSTMARSRAIEALERQRDLERLYGLSRAILLIDRSAPFPQKLVETLGKIFGLSGAALYDHRNNEVYRIGTFKSDELEDQLPTCADHGVTSSDRSRGRTIVPIRLGPELIGSLGLRDVNIAPSVLDGIASLVAIGLERARAQGLAEQIEAARQSEQLRTTLIDAMAHELKTPLTLIKGSTSSLLACPDGPLESRKEQLTIADEEAEHLRKLIDDAVEMARLDTAHIDVRLEKTQIREVVEEVLASMGSEITDRPVEVMCAEHIPTLSLDRRLMRIAVKQLVDNALKYSYPDTPIRLVACCHARTLTIEVRNQGNEITVEEQKRIFERFYRGLSVRQQVPGSGLGLSIARSIVRAHKGELMLTSHPGETIFQITLPVNHAGDTA